MERKIGEIFEYNGEWYQCVKDISDKSCDNCHFYSNYTCEYNVIGYCTSFLRHDGISVCFKKLEKVGEPITVNGKNVQLLKTTIANCDNCAFYKDVNCDFTCYPRKCHGGEEGTYVEIKQNQEDMEEREYSEEEFKSNPRFQHHKNIEQVINMQKMKPFDLEAAKAGKPVCTRDGHKARIVCFDVKGADYPIIALVEKDDIEVLAAYSKDGKCLINTKRGNLDLMMLPKSTRGG